MNSLNLPNLLKPCPRPPNPRFKDPSFSYFLCYRASLIFHKLNKTWYLVYKTLNSWRATYDLGSQKIRK